MIEECLLFAGRSTDYRQSEIGLKDPPLEYYLPSERQETVPYVFVNSNDGLFKTFQGYSINLDLRIEHQATDSIHPNHQ